MLRDNQYGSIIGLLITAIFIFLFVSVIIKIQSDNNGQDDANSEQSLMDQTQEKVNNANDASKKANSILKGLTGD